MSAIQTLNFLDFIAANGDELTTTSLQVAVVHRKRHDDVLRLIRKRMADAGEWGLRNFAEGVYFDPRNQQHHPMFTLTQDGYAFIVGKLSGKLSAQHQIAYIEAFNAMKAYIRNQRDGLRYKCAAKELECADSKRRASIHGRGLNQRRLEKPVLEAELAALQNMVQPSLLN